MIHSSNIFKIKSVGEYKLVWPRRPYEQDSIDLKFKIPHVKMCIFSPTRFVSLNQESEQQIYQSIQLRKTIVLKSPSTIIHRSKHCKVKIFPEGAGCQTSLKQAIDHGYLSLGKVKPQYSISKEPCFNLLVQNTNFITCETQLKNYNWVDLIHGRFNQMMLQSDDIIRLGNQVYRVTIFDQFFEQAPKQPSLRWQKQCKNQASILEGTCRFCLSGDQSAQDFMISPCLCTGSCGLVHIQCLKIWLRTRMLNFANSKVVCYNLQSFYCQICKSPLPRYIQLNEQTVQLLPMQLSSRSFVMLERLLENNIVYMIPYREGKAVQISIGRCNVNDLIISDQSIGYKNHAILNIYAGGGVSITHNDPFRESMVVLRRNLYNLEEITIRYADLIYNFSLQKESQ